MGRGIFPPKTVLQCPSVFLCWEQLNTVQHVVSQLTLAKDSLDGGSLQETEA